MPLTSSRFAGNQRLQKAAENNPPMFPGEKGDAVQILQQALVDLGFAMPKSTKIGVLDGIYGNETTAEIRNFQNSKA